VRSGNGWHRAVLGQGGCGTPALQPPAGSCLQVSVCYQQACGVLTDGSAACWGNAFFDENTSPSGTFTQISVDRRKKRPFWSHQQMTPITDVLSTTATYMPKLSPIPSGGMVDAADLKSAVAKAAYGFESRPRH
jgi:hypothetical protein